MFVHSEHEIFDEVPCRVQANGHPKPPGCHVKQPSDEPAPEDDCQGGDPRYMTEMRSAEKHRREYQSPSVAKCASQDAQHNRAEEQLFQHAGEIGVEQETTERIAPAPVATLYLVEAQRPKHRGRGAQRDEAYGGPGEQLGEHPGGWKHFDRRARLRKTHDDGVCYEPKQRYDQKDYIG